VQPTSTSPKGEGGAAWTLYAPWEPSAVSAPAVQVGTKLPELALYGDADVHRVHHHHRDYQDVHHRHDEAQAAKGYKDIFVNILTDTGLVQRYITDWAGTECVRQVD